MEINWSGLFGGSKVKRVNNTTREVKSVQAVREFYVITWSDDKTTCYRKDGTHPTKDGLNITSIEYASIPSVSVTVDSLKFGYELETQSIKGKKYNYWMEKQLNEVKYKAAVDAANAAEHMTNIGEMTEDQIKECLSISPSEPSAILRKLEENCLCVAFPELSTTPSRPSSRGFELMDAEERNVLRVITLAEIKAAAADHKIPPEWRKQIKTKKVPQEPYMEYPFDNMASKALHTWKRDGSVEGPEICLKEPARYNAAISAVNSLISDLGSFRVDTGCSFHVHVSSDRYMPKNNTQSDAFIMLCIRYLIDNMERVPEAVKLRWRDKGKRNQYFGLLKEGKYSFVADRRSEHGTYEFRCFGNIDNIEDATRCLELSRDAFLYAMENYNSFIDVSGSRIQTEFELMLNLFTETMAA